MWEYTEKVKELYKNPKNVGEIPDADVVVDVGSIVCGDALTLYLKLEGDKIVDAKFKTFGCGSAIASSSALTEMIKGKTIEEAAKITNKDIVEFLGGLPDQKMHCSVMGQEALEKAIKKIKGHAVEDEHEDEGAIVCQCFGVSENLIRRLINENHLTTVEEVTNYTKAGGACGSCIPKIEDIIKEELAKGSLQKVDSGQKPMSNIKRMQLVEETIENVIRPVLMRDGGDIELVDIDGKKVYVALRGHCAQCVISDVTMKNLVQDKLHEFVENDIEVIEVK